MGWLIFFVIGAAALKVTQQIKRQDAVRFGIVDLA